MGLQQTVYSQETHQKSQGKKKLRDLTEICKTWAFDPQVWIKIQQLEELSKKGTLPSLQQLWSVLKLVLLMYLLKRHFF